MVEKMNPHKPRDNMWQKDHLPKEKMPTITKKKLREKIQFEESTVQIFQIRTSPSDKLKGKK